MQDEKRSQLAPLRNDGCRRLQPRASQLSRRMAVDPAGVRASRGVDLGACDRNRPEVYTFSAQFRR